MKKMIKEDILEMKRYMLNNKWLVFWVILACILAYGFELSNWTMTVDEELYLNTERFLLSKLAVGDGRWGIALLKVLLPTYNCIPFFETFLTLGILIVAVLLFVYCLDRVSEDKGAQLVYAVVFMTMLIHAFWIMFSSISTEMAVGFFLIGICVFCFDDGVRKKQKSKMVLSIVTLTFAIAIYQAFILLYIQLVCGLVIMHAITENEAERKWAEGKNYIFASVAFLIISVFSYFIVNFLTTTFIYKSTYVESYVRWGTQTWDVIMADIIKWLKIWYLTPTELLSGSGLILFAHFLYFIAVIFYFATMKNNKGIFVLAMVGNVLSIGLFICAFGGSMPVRAMLSVASYCAFSLYLFMHKFRGEIMRSVCSVCAVVIVLNQAANVTKLYYDENQRSKKDFMLATQLCDDINKFMSDNNCICRNNAI